MDISTVQVPPNVSVWQDALQTASNLYLDVTDPNNSKTWSDLASKGNPGSFFVSSYRTRDADAATQLCIYVKTTQWSVCPVSIVKHGASHSAMCVPVWTESGGQERSELIKVPTIDDIVPLLKHKHVVAFSPDNWTQVNSVCAVKVKLLKAFVFGEKKGLTGAPQTPLPWTDGVFEFDREHMVKRDVRSSCAKVRVLSDAIDTFTAQKTPLFSHKDELDGALGVLSMTAQRPLLYRFRDVTGSAVGYKSLPIYCAWSDNHATAVWWFGQEFNSCVDVILNKRGAADLHSTMCQHTRFPTHATPHLSEILLYLVSLKFVFDIALTRGDVNSKTFLSRRAGEFVLQSYDEQPMSISDVKDRVELARDKANKAKVPKLGSGSPYLSDSYQFNFVTCDELTLDAKHGGGENTSSCPFCKVVATKV